jgi:glutaconate CoA-transferase, subunit B
MSTPSSVEVAASADPRERMIRAAARRLNDGDVVLIGVGAPAEAAIRAQRAHAPGLKLVYESGSIGAQLDEPTLSIGDPMLFAGALGAFSLADMFAFVIEGGRLDVGFVGAAEIDRQSRLNSTVVGDYASPKLRLPGSGGACEIVNRARRVLVMTPLERRRFPECVQYVTSAPPPGVEVVVVTDRAVLRRAADDEELRLASLFPGETVESVGAEIGWPLQVAGDLEVEDDAPLARPR